MFPLEKKGGPAFEEDGPFFMVVAGGPEPEPARLEFPVNAVVIAADGGWRLCRELDLKVTLLVGDMDTLFPEEVSQAEAQGTEVRRFPSDKDQSDLELAIVAAHAMGARRLTILGALGGQWDHCLTNLLAPLSLCHSLGIWGRLVTTGAEIYLLGPGEHSVRGEVGTRISLAPLSAHVSGLTLRGLLYPLEGAEMARHQTMGLANALRRTPACISLESGDLLVTLVR